MSKIGVNIVGYWHTKNAQNEYLWKKANIRENIIEPLKREHNVKTYLTAYPMYGDSPTGVYIQHTDPTELIEYYNPKKCNILNFEFNQLSINNVGDQRLTYITSLNSLLDENLDIIISTRFDIFFHKPITSYVENIDFNKFNFLFKESALWSRNRFTTDNFYIFPKNLLNKVADSVGDLYNNPPRSHCSDLHGLYNVLEKRIGEDNINFISHTEQSSTSNDIYCLTRYI